MSNFPEAVILQAAPRPGEYEIISICEFRTPPAEYECWEAIWSEGRACKKCYKECYRAGWTKNQVDADNQQRVNAKKAKMP